MASSKRKAAQELLEDLMSKPLPDHASYSCLDELDITPAQRRDLTYDDVFWVQLIQKSLHGDMKAIQEILDRRFGKAPQHITQDVRTYSYADFLDTIEVDESKTIDVEIPPQVADTDSPEGGGSSGDELLDDLGLS